MIGVLYRYAGVVVQTFTMGLLAIFMIGILSYVWFRDITPPHLSDLLPDEIGVNDSCNTLYQCVVSHLVSAIIEVSTSCELNTQGHIILHRHA